MSDYFFVIGDLESFARKKRLLSGSLFEIEDPAITGKIVTAVNADKIFRFTHKKQMKNISDLAQYLHNYTKMQAATCPSVQQEPQSTVQPVVDLAAEKQSLTPDHTITSDESAEKATISPSEVESVPENKPEETDTDPGRTAPIQESAESSEPGEPDNKEKTNYTVDFVNKSDYAFTHPISVSYFEEISYESSWRDVYVKVCQLLFEDYPDDFESLRDNDSNSSGVYKLIHSEGVSSHLTAPVKIGDDYYVETNRSASDLMRNIKLLLDYCRIDYENLVITYEKTTEKRKVVVPVAEPVQVPVEEQSVETTEDPVVSYLKQCGLQYIDFRHKLGCLWIIGGRDITDKMEVLHKSGVRMHFRAGGGNATGGRAAWWTKDTISEPIRWVDNSAGNATQPPSKATAPERCTVQEGRAAFQSWMGANGISNNSARTAAWALTKVSDIAVEQGITVDPLYTICDASEVDLIVARLENNRAFQEYQRQNTVALFAARKYAAFRKEQGKCDTSTGVLTAESTADDLECKIQNARKDFSDYMLKRSYSLSTVRGMASAVTGVSEYANEHGFLSQSVFLLTDYNQLQDFWNKLQNDPDFYEYNRSQNRRFTVAMNHFLTYTKDHGKVVPRSSAAPLQPYAPARSTAHPGRVEFERWLKESNCPAGSIKTYADGVESVGKYLLDNGLEYRNIFSIRGIARIEKIQANLLYDKAYAAKTSAGNASLDCYALKKYIAFRKNDSSGDVDDASLERFSAILRDNFENGFRINSIIDRNRFKQFHADMYGEAPSQTDDEIIDILKQIGSIQDERIFLRENSAQNDLLDDIQSEIAEAFADGISCVYLSELFVQHQDELAAQLQVFSSDVLKELLLSTSYGAYRASKHYFYLRDRSPDASADIRKLMQRSSVPLSYSDIYEKLRFIPFDTIRHNLVTTDKMVNVAQETYFYAPNLPVSADELNRIAELIHGQLSQKSFLTDLEMRALIEKNCPSVAINTEGFTTWGLRNCLSVLLGDRFAFNGPIISEKGQALNTSQVFTEFSRSHEVMTLDELKAFAKDINNGIIYWDSVIEVMVRTSPDEFVQKDQIEFDVDAVDRVIDALLDGDYAPLKSFRLFLHFPAISVKWNEFVLESYVAGYSKKFSLLHASYTAAECCGGIVRKESAIKNFQDLVTDVLVHSDTWETKNDALALLVKEGYLQRRHYTRIDTIIPEAKLQRERIESTFKG